jgi:hypothetical protein
MPEAGSFHQTGIRDISRLRLIKADFNGKRTNIATSDLPSGQNTLNNKMKRATWSVSGALWRGIRQ